MNLCCSCKTDFGSVAAFDKHRIGRHAYTHAEGLKTWPARDDGRRCMDTDEMTDAGMEVNAHGRWAITADAARIAEWRAAA